MGFMLLKATWHGFQGFLSVEHQTSVVQRCANGFPFAWFINDALPNGFQLAGAESIKATRHKAAVAIEMQVDQAAGFILGAAGCEQTADC